MKFIKFYMRDRKLNFTVPFEKAEAILNSPTQLVRIHDDEGNWTGMMVNKADIVSTDRDYDEEKIWREKNTPQLPEPETKVENIGELIEKYKPDFLK